MQISKLFEAATVTK